MTRLLSVANGVAAVLVWAAMTAAQPPATQTSPIEAAAFMTGCWRGPAGDGNVIEEIYLAPAPNLMQGISRYLRGAVVIDYEFSLIDVDGQATRLRPHPRGQASVAFAQKAVGPGRILWENLAHDFPQRISYTAAPGDSLVARIEGNTDDGNRSMEWRMGRIPCPVSAGPTP
ncbi:MAG: DUF6265 family protein [Longimicrobiales bacterium]